MACLQGMLNGKEMQNSSLVKSRKWKDLNVDILEKIFNGVPFCDLCNNISFVCHSWRLGCLHTILPLSPPEGSVAKSIRLMRLLKTIMKGINGYGCSLEQWKSSIRNINIFDGVEISDKELLYVAKRMVCLEKLFLCSCSMITRKGMINALYNWKNIKSVFLEKVRFEYVVEFMKEISKNYYLSNWLIVWMRESGLKHEEVCGIIKHLSNEVKMMKVKHGSISEDGFVIGFSSRSDGKDWSVSKEEEPSNIADSLPSSLSLNISLTSIGMRK